MNRSNIKNRVTSLLSISILSLMFSLSISAETINVSSLLELKPYLLQDNVSVKLAPGEYTVTADDVSSGSIGKYWTGTKYIRKNFNVFLFEGNNSTYDFRGVTIKIKTQTAQSVGRVDFYELRTIGSNNVILNLTVVDDGSVHDQPTFRATNVVLDGANNRMEGCHFTIKGSFPYGYGDMFGKGGHTLIDHHKRSACLVRGKSNMVKNSTFICRSYGHGIFFQGAEDPIIDGCYVEGELRSIADVLAEEGTSSPADKVGFETVYGFNLKDRKGNFYFSLQEAGVRSYNAGETIIDGVEYDRGVNGATVLNTTIVKMRVGVNIGWATGTKRIENCRALACETGYWIGSNGKIVNCKGDASIGSLLTEDLYRSKATIDLTLLDNYVTPLDGEVTDIYCAGSGHQITLHDSTTYDNDIKIVIGGKRLAHRFKDGASNKPLNFDADDITFINYSRYPIEVGRKAEDINITTCGSKESVIDNGLRTSVSYNKDCSPIQNVE